MEISIDISRCETMAEAVRLCSNELDRYITRNNLPKYCKMKKGYGVQKIYTKVHRPFVTYKIDYLEIDAQTYHDLTRVN